jgi:uncharacterized membrane protein
MSGFASWRHLIVIAIGYLASLVLFSRIPGFAPGGDPLSARIEIALVLPTAAAVIYLVVSRVWARDSRRETAGAFEPTYGAIVFAVILFLIAIHLMMIGALTGVLTERTWLTRTTIVLFGVLMIRIGDLLPRTRPNLALGFRTPGTLANRCLWIQTHRMAGYLMVCLGLVFMVSGAFLSNPNFERVMVSATLGGPALFVVSYCLYSFRLRKGPAEAGPYGPNM